MKWPMNWRLHWHRNWKAWTAAGVLFGGIGGVLGVAAWVLSSDWGLHWALQQASARLPGTLSVHTHHGTLRGPIMLEDVRYKQDGMDVHLARVELEWDPWHLLSYEFHITRATLTEVNYNVVTSATPATDIPLADFSLPLTISVPQLDIKSLRLVTQAEQPPLVIDSIHLAARAAGSVVDLEQLDISAAQFSLNVSGQLQTRERYPLSLNTAWSVRLPQHPELPELKGQGSLNGDLSAMTLTQELIAPLKLSVQGTLHDALKIPQWKLTAMARGIDPRVFDSQSTLNNFDLELAAQNTVGAADAIETQGVVRSTQAEVGAFEVQWNAGYQNTRIILNSLEARLVDTDTHVRLQAEVDLNAQAPNGIAQINARGQWQKLFWPLRQDAASSAGVHSPTGEFSIAGTTEDYSVKLSAGLQGNALPNSEIKISGTGQAQAITLQTLDITTLGGAVSGNAAVQWNDGVRWQTHLQATALNPGLQWSEWPGLLGFEINSDGAVKNNRVRAELNILKSSGKLRGYPLQVNARVGLDNNVYTVHSAELRSGKAVARVRGGIGSDWALDWEVNAPELAAVYPDVFGAFNAAGKIRGPRDEPRVSYSAQGQQLRYATYTLAKLESHGDVDLNPQRPTQIIARAQKIHMDKGAKVESAAIDEVNFNLEGSLGQHRASATLRAPDASVDISLAGQWRNAVWAAQLEQADITHQRWGTWKLAQAVAWSANATRAQAAETCWLGASGRACVQASWGQVEGIKAQVAVADYPLAALKPILPPDVALTGVLSATLQAHLPPHEHSPARLNTRLQVQLTPGVLSILSLGNEAVNFEHHGGGLNVETDAQGARGEANLDFAQLGNAALNAQLPGWHPERTAAQQPLTGKLRADVRTLKFLARWVPALEQTQGILNAEVNLAGSLAEPQYAGRVTLNNGAAALPQLGIHLSKVSLDIHHRDTQHLEFHASASSGPGQVDIRGEVKLDRAAGWPVTAEIKGKDFEAINLPEAWVLASPELQVYKAHSRIDLNGLLLIPQARYTARDISTVQTPSGDVVLVNADNKPRIDANNASNASPAPAGTGNDEKLKIYTTVRFSFGDQVSFDGFGLKGLIRGEVVAFDEPKKLTTGYGELQIVDAIFNAYKIDLKVTRGRLLFAGGPINNPGIDARAIREVGAIRQVERKDKPSELRESGADVAGALVRGTLRKLELTLFSEPPRDQADVLSLLLFGVPLGDATSEEGKALFLAASSLRLSGQDETLRKIGRRFGIDEIRLNAGSTPDQAALVIGRYLGPRLYINYSVGLLTSGSNVLRFRYRVSSKWILQSEQSDAESAADLLYTFER